MAYTTTLLEFASEKVITLLLVKERSKCRKHNKTDKKNRLDQECDIYSLSRRKMLSRMMPPRHTWVRPSKRSRLPNRAADTSKNTIKALLLTIDRDRKLSKNKGLTFIYLQELDAFIERIKKLLANGQVKFDSPHLIPLFKSTKIVQGSVSDVICRPIVIYRRLEDKVIIALTNLYLTFLVDEYLHENILSYRPPRLFHGQERHITNFNDGIALIKKYYEVKRNEDIYVADCDIKKFYDIIPHSVVLDSFNRLLKKTSLTYEGKSQVLMVLKAYLDSYDFYTNVLMESQRIPKQYFAKVRCQLNDIDNVNNYQIEWVDEIMALPEKERLHRGVPQGGALSLIIANVVLNDVDQVIVAKEDSNRLFIRYCDDMILMHTSSKECKRLMNAYTTSLTEHGLYYHALEHVSDSKDLKFPEITTKRFWNTKSHYTFKWDFGSGDCNSYIGFLAYEMRCDGKLRLRKSNVLRFKEKINRRFYAIRRYKKSDKHSEEEKSQHEKQTLDQLLAGVNFYKSFQSSHFKQGRQYQYFMKLRTRVEARLAQIDK
ncbi:MAG: hypothetical protein IK100_00320 [Muribaculaceae bacterium]|nr:hypothetical protein [Muribaculaceae bacterium]